MNLNVLKLLTDLLKSLQSGDVKPAVCTLGQLATAVTCDKPAAMLAAAKKEDGTGLTWTEFHAECQEKCANIKAACEHNEHLVKTGASSDTALPPGFWLSIASFAVEILQFFVKKNTMGGADAPLPKPPEPPKPEAPPADAGAPKAVPLPGGGDSAKPPA